MITVLNFIYKQFLIKLIFYHSERNCTERFYLFISCFTRIGLENVQRIS